MTEIAEWKRLAEEAGLQSEREHDPGCPTVADDESDYEYLSDAGVCACGAGFANASRVAVPALVRALEEAREDAARLAGALETLLSSHEAIYRAGRASHDSNPAVERARAALSQHREREGGGNGS